jgi:hypothetical protein
MRRTKVLIALRRTGRKIHIHDREVMYENRNGDDDCDDKEEKNGSG